MSYFNGSLHGWNGPKGYEPPKPITKIYCDICAETQIPLPPVTQENHGRRHWSTDFRWAPVFGDKCHHCKKEC